MNTDTVETVADENITDTLDARVENDVTDDEELEALPEFIVRKLKEDRQLDKMLQEHPPSHWIKGSDKITVVEDGEERVETHEEWKERVELEDRLIELYMRGDVLPDPQPTYIKERDGVVKSARRIRTEEKFS